MITLTPEQKAKVQTLPEKWLSPIEAARLLSISVRTLWRLTANGELPAPARFSRKLVRFNRRALLDHMLGLTGGGGRPILIRDHATGQEEFHHASVLARA